MHSTPEVSVHGNTSGDGDLIDDDGVAVAVDGVIVSWSPIGSVVRQDLLTLRGRGRERGDSNSGSGGGGGGSNSTGSSTTISPSSVPILFDQL
jgi:hypothetical protein